MSGWRAEGSDGADDEKVYTPEAEFFFFLKGGLGNEHLKFYLLFCVTTKTALLLEGIFMCVGSGWKDKVK